MASQADSQFDAILERMRRELGTWVSEENPQIAAHGARETAAQRTAQSARPYRPNLEDRRRPDDPLMTLHDQANVAIEKPTPWLVPIGPALMFDEDISRRRPVSLLRQYGPPAFQRILDGM